jgi:hypothetical protein
VFIFDHKRDFPSSSSSFPFKATPHFVTRLLYFGISKAEMVLTIDANEAANCELFDGEHCWYLMTMVVALVL